MKKYLLLFVICNFYLLANDNYPAVYYDLKFSPYSGATNMLSEVQYLDNLENKAIEKFQKKPSSIDNIGEEIPKPVIEEKPLLDKIVLGFSRLTELSFFWAPLNDLLITTQHEVFGHGYRIRDIGSKYAEVISYHIDIPYPYGEGGGATYFEFSEDIPHYLSASIAAAGTEATAILAHQLKSTWLQNDAINPRQSSLYLGSFHDLSVYIASLSFIGHDSEGHDIAGYIEEINNAYPNYDLRRRSLKKLAALNYIDPLTYYSFYAQMRYIFTGKQAMHIPCIKIKNLKMLPNTRLSLAPYGPEIYLENYLLFSNKPAYTYIRTSYFNKSFLGMGYEDKNLITTDFGNFGLRVDVWKQPNFFKIYPFNSENLFGFLGSVIYSKNLNNFNFFGNIGGKTAGFIPGRSLDAACIFGIGCSGRF